MGVVQILDSKEFNHYQSYYSSKLSLCGKLYDLVSSQKCRLQFKHLSRVNYSFEYHLPVLKIDLFTYDKQIGTTNNFPLFINLLWLCKDETHQPITYLIEFIEYGLYFLYNFFRVCFASLSLGCQFY